MPKDALGHGSNAHNAGIAALPTKQQTGTNTGRNLASGDVYSGMSEKTWQATMPRENYGGMISDMLGMWTGTHKPSQLLPDEKRQVDEAYAKRAPWRDVARTLHDARSGGAFITSEGLAGSTGRKK